MGILLLQWRPNRLSIHPPSNRRARPPFPLRIEEQGAFGMPQLPAARTLSVPSTPRIISPPRIRGSGMRSLYETFVTTHQSPQQSLAQARVVQGSHVSPGVTQRRPRLPATKAVKHCRFMLIFWGIMAVGLIPSWGLVTREGVTRVGSSCHLKQ